jgi:hypothetical protein
MASGAEEFKAFEATGWSRRASTYGHVTGAITARFVDSLLDAARVGAAGGRLALSPAARERARAAFAELVEPHRVVGGHEVPAVAKVGSGRRP